jgi:hypothetical protein
MAQGADLAMPLPAQPKIYHIVHVDRLASIMQMGLLSDAEVLARGLVGTTIGMGSIKERRLKELTLQSHPGLYVGQCVPFYFCPRSIMLYLIHQANHAELVYKGGQAPVVHLQADLHATVRWAQGHGRRWAFTLSNAGSRYFEDRADLARLGELNWDAINALQWQNCKEAKQAEFLVEQWFPWQLVEAIGVYGQQQYQLVVNNISTAQHQPPVHIQPAWYY